MRARYCARHVPCADHSRAPCPLRGRSVLQLNEELNDVQDIMKQNIQDVLGRGEKLDSVAAKSSSLRDASGKYAKDARYLNTRAMLRKYGPLAVVLLFVLLVIYWRFFR